MSVTSSILNIFSHLKEKPLTEPLRTLAEFAKIDWLLTKLINKSVVIKAAMSTCKRIIHLIILRHTLKHFFTTSKNQFLNFVLMKAGSGTKCRIVFSIHIPPTNTKHRPKLSQYCRSEFSILLLVLSYLCRK